MAQDMDELSSIISGWLSIASVWDDKKSKMMEEMVISQLEHAVNDLGCQLEEIVLLGQNIEDEVTNIERTGELYGW